MLCNISVKSEYTFDSPIFTLYPVSFNMAAECAIPNKKARMGVIDDEHEPDPNWPSCGSGEIGRSRYLLNKSFHTK